jgi:hypothetical protein
VVAGLWAGCFPPPAGPDGHHAQLFEVVEMLLNAFEVAAVAGATSKSQARAESR